MDLSKELNLIFSKEKLTPAEEIRKEELLEQWQIEQDRIELQRWKNNQPI